MMGRNANDVCPMSIDERMTNSETRNYRASVSEAVRTTSEKLRGSECLFYLFVLPSSFAICVSSFPNQCLCAMRSAINIKNYHAPETKREEESVACKSESKGDRAEIGGLKTNGASKSQKRFDLPDRRHWR